MNEHLNEEKSCGPQPFDGTPQKGWTVDRLRDFAGSENHAITQSECAVTPHYWRLGGALILLRRNFSRGQWGKCLEKLGIEKTRASKARAINRSFESEESVEQLSVQLAYAQRERKPRKSPPKKCRKQSGKRVQRSLADWLHEFGMLTDIYVKEVASLESSEAANLVPTIDALIEDLTSLRECVKERAGFI